MYALFIFIYEVPCFYLNGVSLLAQMGIRFCRQRRPISLEPEPEGDPVEQSPSSDSHSSADSVEEEQIVEATTVAPVVVTGIPTAVAFDLPPESENFRLTLGAPVADQTAEAGYRFYAVWVIPNLANQRLFAGVHWGQDICAYSGILTLNNREFTGIRWRRAWSDERAVAFFSREADQHGVGGRPVIHFRWQFRQVARLG